MALASLLLVLLAICRVPVAAAQELSPRAYWPAPTGTKLISIAYVNTGGDVVIDPSLPVSGVDSDIDTLLLAYRHTTDWFGRTSTVILEMPMVQGETSGRLEDDSVVTRDLVGVGDVAATLSVNLLGAPAMDAEGFQALRRDPHPTLGASVRVVAPTGKYSEDRIVNVSANRWASKLELGYMLPIHRKWLFEAEIGVWLFGDNDEFALGRREQKPIWAGEFHLVHRFNPGFWASLDFNYFRGGQTIIDGDTKDDLQRNTTAGLTLVFPFVRRQSIKVGYGRGSVRVSDNDFYNFVVSYQRVF
ncbi:MAG: transporter [Pseudomonadota bacterium]